MGAFRLLTPGNIILVGHEVFVFLYLEIFYDPQLSAIHPRVFCHAALY